MRIGILGFAGAGKDIFAQMLSESTGLPVVSFAKPLHDAAKYVFGENCLERENKKRLYSFGERGFERLYEYNINFISELSKLYPIVTIDTIGKIGNISTIFQTKGYYKGAVSPRELMQWYGSEYWRAMMPNVFINLVRDTYQDCIIADVRFENEALLCNKLVCVQREGVDAVNGHVSEKLAASIERVDDYTTTELTVPTFTSWVDTPLHVIPNNGTLDDLRDKVRLFKNNL